MQVPTPCSEVYTHWTSAGQLVSKPILELWQEIDKNNAYMKLERNRVTNDLVKMSTKENRRTDKPQTIELCQHFLAGPQLVKHSLMGLHSIMG